MKKKISLLIITLFLFASIPAKSMDIKELLSQIGFNVFSQKDAKTEITKVLEKQEHYTNKKNYNKLRLLFSEDYANYDGISLDDYIASIEKTHSMHSKLTYKTIINSIIINGEYATVDATDISEGTTKNEYKNIEGKGILNSTSKTFYYLKKENGNWKISADYVYSEKTSLKYGSAKDIEIILDAPECIKANSEYNIKIRTTLPEKTGIIAAIVTEPIQYPQIMQSEDIFRPIKQDGELERVVVSNNEGKNEVAFASMAIAKAELSENQQLDIQMDGVAFIASRVNVIPRKVKEDEQKK